MTRRRWLLAGALLLEIAACARALALPRGDPHHLAARPHAPTGEPLAPGTYELDAGTPRPALLYVPARVALEPALVVTLHGAGADPHQLLDVLRPYADRTGALLLAPASRGSSWDVLRGGSQDTAALDRALEQVLARFPVDPARVAVAGISDGASYALTLALENGELFRRAIAFSPGLLAAEEPIGRPRIYVSHATEDRVLPIALTSKRIVPRLRALGYDVRYHEIAGGHRLPPDIVDEAWRWLYLD